MFAAFIRPLLSVVLTLAEAQRLPDKAYDGRAFDLTGRVYCKSGQQSFVLEDETGRVLVWGYSTDDAAHLTPGSRVTARVRAIVNDNGKNLPTTTPSSARDWPPSSASRTTSTWSARRPTGFRPCGRPWR